MEEQATFERLPAEYRAQMLRQEESIFFNVALFEQAQRVAKLFSDSTMVPEHFRNNVGNCMIGLNYAARIKGDPFMVLQSLYVVHGRPGIEAKLVEAVINESGKYSEPLQYEWLDPEDKATTRNVVLKAKDGEFGCQAFTVEKKSGKRVDGPKITWNLVKAEGWYDKPGPDKSIKTNKWRTMPEMMFYYRSASWFANKNCPELKLGMHTKEELEESIIDITPIPNLAPKNGAPIEGDPYAVKESPKKEEASPSAPPQKEPEKPIDGGTLPPKEETLYDKLMSARQLFKGLIMGNFKDIEKLPPKQFEAVKEKWEEGSIVGKYGVTKGAPWPLVEAQVTTSPAPEGKAQEPETDAPTDEDKAFMAEATRYLEALEPKTWDLVTKLCGMQDKDIKDMPKDDRSMFLERCRVQLEKQNQA